MDLTLDRASMWRKTSQTLWVNSPGQEDTQKYLLRTWRNSPRYFPLSIWKNSFFRTHFPIVENPEESARLAAKLHGRGGRRWPSQPVSSRLGSWEHSTEGWWLSWRTVCPTQGGGNRWLLRLRWLKEKDLSLQHSEPCGFSYICDS